MLDTIAPGQQRPDQALVRHYLAALNNGQILDALNAFSMDALLRDESGRERHGIREIAAAFAQRERPIKVEIEELRSEGDAVAVRVRMSFPKDRTPEVYRSLFHVRRNRIHALEMDPLPPSPSARGRFVRPA